MGTNPVHWLEISSLSRIKPMSHHYRPLATFFKLHDYKVGLHYKKYNLVNFKSFCNIFKNTKYDWIVYISKIYFFYIPLKEEWTVATLTCKQVG